MNHVVYASEEVQARKKRKKMAGSEGPKKGKVR